MNVQNDDLAILYFGGNAFEFLIKKDIKSLTVSVTAF